MHCATQCERRLIEGTVQHSVRRNWWSAGTPQEQLATCDAIKAEERSLWEAQDILAGALPQALSEAFQAVEHDFLQTTKVRAHGPPGTTSCRPQGCASMALQGLQDFSSSPLDFAVWGCMAAYLDVQRGRYRNILKMSLGTVASQKLHLY